MKLRTLLALVLLVIAAGLAAAGPAAATMVVKTNTVATGPAADSDVACADGHVVWAEKEAATGWDIWGATYNVIDGSVGTPYVICAAAGDQRHPRVSGDYVVWQDHRGGSWDIYGRAVDALTPELPVCVAAGDQTNPDIYTNRIVWQDRRSGNWNIWYAGLNLGSGAIDATYVVASGPHNEVTPSVSGDRVVYATDRNGNWDIYSVDVTMPDVQSSVVTNAARQDQPCVWGFRVVWRDFRNVKGNGTDIWGHSFSTNATFPVVQAAADQSQPRLYDDVVVCSDWRTAFLTGSSAHGPDIGYHDMTLTEDGPVCIANGSQNQPAVFGNDVFWIDQRVAANNGDVRHAQLSPWSAYTWLTKTGASRQLFWTNTPTLDLHLFAISKYGTVSSAGIHNQGDPGVVPVTTFTPDSDGVMTTAWSLDTGLPPELLVNGRRTVETFFHDDSGIALLEYSPTVTTSVMYDTTPPVAHVKPAYGTHGGSATISYRANDNLAPRCQVTIFVQSKSGTTVKKFKIGWVKAGAWHTKTFACGLAKGTYNTIVTARDMAGNTADAAGGHLYVK